MRKLTAVLVLLIVSLSAHAAGKKRRYSATGNPEVRIDKFAFGSCNIQAEDQSHWKMILEQKPQLWLWLGDIIYADQTPPFLRRAMYNMVKKNKHYKSLISSTPVLGTWDDHDYGSNNIGREYDKKDKSQAILLDFLDEPKDSARRKQKGVYASYVYGPEGQRTQMVVLDLRYFRDKPGPEAELLGEEQWKWLENTLLTQPAELRFIGSSSQVIPEHDGDTWARFPKERKRLLSILEKTQGKVVFLSGDRHQAEFSMFTAPSGQKFYEFTSSGLTHFRESENDNPFRIGSLYKNKNFGLVTVTWRESTPQVRFEIHHAKDGKLIEALDIE